MTSSTTDKRSHTFTAPPLRAHAENVEAVASCSLRKLWTSNVQAQAATYNGLFGAERRAFPLIALMKDQVDALRRLNVPAASMDSSLSMEEMADVRRQIREGTLKLLYVAPERLNNENFVQMIMEQEISLLAVDESHCISEWGPSFRPDYLKVARFAKEVGAQRVLCLTATATPSVAQDICAGFDIDVNEGLFQTGNFRSNLELQIQPSTDQESKIKILVPFLQSRKGGAAIVYATTQGNAEEISRSLNAKGVDSKVYHAGLTADVRKEIQNWFMKSDGVVVATIAFGMGIDKANIRQVAHAFMPKTLQEIGRAGRDGLPSTCLMLPSPNDLPILESFARANTPSRNSIRDWLLAVFSAPVAADGSLDFSLYEQANTFDISRNTLGLLYAQLELQNELLRAVTPFYQTYTLKPMASNPGGWDRVLADKSNEAVAIRKYWTAGTIWHTLDIVSAALKAGIDRAELARQITRWEQAGELESKVSGVRNRFQPLKDLPTNKKEIEDLADTLFKQMTDREEADVARLKGVAAFASGSQSPFNCPDHLVAIQFCKTGRAIHFNPNISLPPNEAAIKAVLSVCGVRDDSRFLARVAFGISSPRATLLGLSRNPIFGSCPNADFGQLIERFEKECKKAGYKNLATLAPPKAAPAKRAYGGTAKGAPAKKATRYTKK
ncbi:hypothetical protein P7C70_g4720, partial [Phenoliferia sp. Uapishka_3]